MTLSIEIMENVYAPGIFYDIGYIIGAIGRALFNTTIF